MRLDIPATNQANNQVNLADKPNLAQIQKQPEHKKSVAVDPSANSMELKKEGYTATEIQQMKATGKIQCETCSSRTYVDGSDDPGVSFKTPTKLSPAQAATAVMSHEQEHVTRNASEAQREGREVVSSSVSIYHAICPECGKNYVAGGLTRTTTQKMKENDHFKNKMFEEGIGKHMGKNIGKNVDEKV